VDDAVLASYSRRTGGSAGARSITESMKAVNLSEQTAKMLVRISFSLIEQQLKNIDKQFDS
jgi:hypothetical protein